MGSRAHAWVRVGVRGTYMDSGVHAWVKVRVTHAWFTVGLAGARGGSEQQVVRLLERSRVYLGEGGGGQGLGFKV